MPGDCLLLTDDAEEMRSLAEQAAGAARDFDASVLSGLVDRVQQVQERMQAHAEACRGTSTASVTGPATTS